MSDLEFAWLIYKGLMPLILIPTGLVVICGTVLIVEMFRNRNKDDL